MNRLLPVLLSVLISIPLAAGGSIADVVILENGDRISGKTIRMENGILTFNTEYAGEVSIDWNRVAALTTDAPLQVVLLDGTTAEMPALFSRGGKADEIELEGEKALEKFEAADVKSLHSKPKPRVKIIARANAGLSNERGNTDTDSYHIDAELVTRTEKHRFTLGGELNNQKAQKEATAENWQAYGKYDFFISKSWFLYTAALFEHDKFADLDLRTTLGAGAGFQFFESKELNLSASVGGSYVDENFIVATDDEFYAGQWILRYDQFFFNQSVQLFHSNNGTVSLEEADNWQIKTRQGLRFPLYRGLTATFQYNYDYNNKPSPDALSKWDSRTLFLLGYEFRN